MLMSISRILSEKSNVFLIVNLFRDSGFNFSSNHLARKQLYVPVAERIGIMHMFFLCAFEVRINVEVVSLLDAAHPQVILVRSFLVWHSDPSLFEATDDSASVVCLLIW